MDELGVKDPETEFNRWLEEREIILQMNKGLNSSGKTKDSSGNRLNASATRGRARGRVLEPQAEDIEE